MSYNFSLTTFSPTGELGQIKYAINAVNGGTTSIAIKCTYTFYFLVSAHDIASLNSRSYNILTSRTRQTRNHSRNREEITIHSGRLINNTQSIPNMWQDWSGILGNGTWRQNSYTKSTKSRSAILHEIPWTTTATDPRERSGQNHARVYSKRVR